MSRQAVDGRFSLATLGGGLIRLCKALPYVKAAEVLVVTSSPADTRELSMIGDRAPRRIAALNKMTTELVRECETCGFNDVCSQLEDFRVSRRTLQGGGTSCVTVPRVRGSCLGRLLPRTRKEVTHG